MSETEIIVKILNNDNEINTVSIENLKNLTNIIKNKKVLNLKIKKLSKDDFVKYKKLINLNSIYSFECFNVDLNRIPIMVNVRILKAQNCKLYSMANYYANLIELNCSFNNLQFLPKIPKCEILNCQNNQILSLPELKNVKKLNCSNNNISFLPSIPNCENLILSGNPIIYYSEEIKNKFKLKISPMTEMVYDYININNQLISMIDVSVRKEDRIEYLFEANFKNEKDFIDHLKKLLFNFEKIDIDKKFENFLKQIITNYKYKNKYIKYKIKYHKLKSKIRSDIKS